MNCVARIAAGVCGFATNVTARSKDDQEVILDIQTDCEKIGALAESLNGRKIDGYQEIGAGFGGVVMSAARSHLSGCCAGCAVPAGIFKALQVAARVALPRDISITMKTE
jgi:hypothetical protein